MRKFVFAALLLGLMLVFLPAGYAELEFSCTSSQNVAIHARLDALPVEDKSRFEGTAHQIEQEVAQLQEKGKTLEKEYLTLFFAEQNKLLEANPEIRDKIVQATAARQSALVNQYATAVASEHPDLAQRAHEGDQEASRQVTQLLWEKLAHDPIFNAEFQNQAAKNDALNDLLMPRLAANPIYDAKGAGMVNFQQQLNDKEAEQEKFKSGLPSRESDHLATQTAASIAAEHDLPSATVTNTRAFRDLLVTVDFAGKIRDATNDTQLQPFALQKFDTEVGREANDAGLGNLVESAELVRAAMREVKGEALNVRLGFSGAHIGQYLPPASLRSEAMKNPKSELARSLVATTAALLNKETNVQQSIKLLEKLKIPARPSIDKIDVPAPAAQSTPASQPAWAKQLATEMKETSDIVFQYIVVPKKKD